MHSGSFQLFPLYVAAGAGVVRGGGGLYNQGMKELLAQLIHGTPLTYDQTQSAFTDIMDGTADPAQTASLLTLLAGRGGGISGGEPTVEELQGAATVMRRHVVAIDAPEDVIDTCGTGGTGSIFF